MAHEWTIVADENIPLVEEAFSPYGTVRIRPGEQIDRSELAGADVLLARSVTTVDRKILQGTPVRFVGSATSGTDHVDRAYLDRRGIEFAHAPGSNADSVVEYVLAALARLTVRRKTSLRGATVGVVGCGAIGSRLVDRLPAAGLTVLPNDPPRAEAARARGDDHPFVPLDRLLEEADVLTLHVPLKRSGAYPTFHLIGERELAALSDRTCLINASRGAVVDAETLLETRRAGGLGALVLDVFEEEPTPNPELIERCDLATPHVAGYSYDGKLAGTIAIYRAFCAWGELDDRWTYERHLELGAGVDPVLEVPDPDLPPFRWIDRLIRPVYDIEVDDRGLRAAVAGPKSARAERFAGLRRNYRRRRSFTNFSVPRAEVPPDRRRLVEDLLRIGWTE